MFNFGYVQLFFIAEVDIPAVDVWKYAGGCDADAEGQISQSEVAVDTDDAVRRGSPAQRRSDGRHLQVCLRIFSIA